MNPTPSPIISVITVCRNAEATLESCIRSVLEQTLTGIEYLIVDGASSDGTQDILQRYRDRLDRILSEPDRGIYDAMNKGLRMARGTYVYFLNADDRLNGPDMLEKAFRVCSDADCYYGDVLFTGPDGGPGAPRSLRTPHRVPLHLNWKSLRTGMVISHQGFIIRRSLAPEFDLSFQVSADIDWMIRCLKTDPRVCNTQLVIACFRTGGTSKKKQLQAWKERYRILGRHYGFLPNLLAHIFISCRYLLSSQRY